VVALVDSSGVRSTWLVGVGAAGSVEGLVAYSEGGSACGPLKVPLRRTGSWSHTDMSDFLLGSLCGGHTWHHRLPEQDDGLPGKSISLPRRWPLR
jgi:hypothetical protein